jgi:hypothetical protein
MIDPLWRTADLTIDHDAPRIVAIEAHRPGGDQANGFG